MTALAVLLAALAGARPACAALSAPEASPGPISSSAISSPYDLVRGPASPTPELATVPWFGETLDYEVKWGIFSVGWSDLEAKQLEDFNGSPAVRIVSKAESNGFCDAFYKVRDLNEAWIDARRLSSLGYSKKLREGRFFRDEWVLYDYARRSFLAKTTNADGSFKVKVGTIPVPVQDILSSLYFLRSRPLRVGDEIILDVNTKKNWPLVVKVLRRAKITVPAGTFQTVVVEPFLRHEGIFIQKGKRLQVWMTDDARHLPVYMSVEVFFGSISAALVKPPPNDGR